MTADKATRMDPQELNVEEVARRLNTPILTLLRWIRQGKIPMSASGDGYVIRREMLERWAREHKLSLHWTPPATAPAEPPPGTGLVAAMRRGGVLYHLPGDSKAAVLKAAVSVLPNIPEAERELLYIKLLEREQLASTGIGHGVALPHPRVNPAAALAHSQISTCFLSEAVPFEAVDHQPVRVLMVLLSTSTKEHLNLLSRLALCLRDSDFVAFLQAVPQ